MRRIEYLYLYSISQPLVITHNYPVSDFNIHVGYGRLMAETAPYTISALCELFWNVRCSYYQELSFLKCIVLLECGHFSMYKPRIDKN